jgi:hypothetical protein
MLLALAELADRKNCADSRWRSSGLKESLFEEEDHMDPETMVLVCDKVMFEVIQMNRGVKMKTW